MSWIYTFSLGLSAYTKLLYLCSVFSMAPLTQWSQDIVQADIQNENMKIL